VQRARYARRLSAPLLDRFDLRVQISPDNKQIGESSTDVALRVRSAVERQRARLRGTPWRRNAHIPAGALECYTPLSSSVRAVWHELAELRALSGRGAARVRRVARTVADLNDRPDITVDDVERATYMREDLW
jgi:magnesium chelatase family protein